MLREVICAVDLVARTVADVVSPTQTEFRCVFIDLRDTDTIS